MGRPRGRAGSPLRQPEPWFRLQGLFHLHGYGGIHRALECPAKVLPVSADRPEKEPEFLRARSQDLGTEDPWGPGGSRSSSLRAPRGHGALAPFKGSTAWPCRGGLEAALGPQGQGQDPAGMGRAGVGRSSGQPAARPTLAPSRSPRLRGARRLPGDMCTRAQEGCLWLSVPPRVV